MQTGFGFGFGLSVFLSAFGLLVAGDLVSGKYSIDGADDRVFEIDGSIIRQEYHSGNNANFLLQRWGESVEISEQHGSLFNAQTQAEHNDLRYEQPARDEPAVLRRRHLARGYVNTSTPPPLPDANPTQASHAARLLVHAGLPYGTAPNAADRATARARRRLLRARERPRRRAVLCR